MSVALVTGAAGFLGAHLISSLSNRGFDIVALIHLRSLHPDLAARCKNIISGDLCDANTLRAAVRGVDLVCHAAAYIPATRDDLTEAAQCQRINAQATLELAQAAAEAGARRFTFLSTGNMYAPSGSPCHEDSPIYPAHHATGYFASKLVAELYLSNLARRVDMQFLILRIGTPYGPGESQSKVIPTFLRRAANGESIRIVAPQARFNFVYARDAAECVAQALREGEPGIYNVSSGEHTSLLELAYAAAKLFPDRSVPIESDSSNCSDPGFSPMSIERARAVLRFAPRSLSTGLRDYVANRGPFV